MLYVAFLRGINVGGHNMIKMAELKALFESIGFGRVQTYIQSGNVLFESAEAEVSLRPTIEQAIAAAFGFPVITLLRSAPEMAQIVVDCPFRDLATGLPKGQSLHVALLAEAPALVAVERLLAVPGDTDECRVAGREICLLCRQPYHTSLFTNSFLEKKLGVPATTRNWQTITKLAGMCQP